MSVRMKLSFASPEPEDEDKGFSPDEPIDEGPSLEERIAEFKRDEELMRETNRFVDELIEAANIEAQRRIDLKAKAESVESNKFKGSQTLAGWNNRAKGLCNRVWNAVFPCFNNNELLAWTQPFRYRFTRP